MYAVVVYLTGRVFWLKLYRDETEAQQMYQIARQVVTTLDIGLSVALLEGVS